MTGRPPNAGRGPSWKRWLLAAALAVLGLGVLLWMADLNALAAAWAHITLWPFALAAGLFLANLTAQAWRLRTLAGNAGTGPLPSWLRLAAVHQVIFTLLPSGAGDLGFPLLAARYVGMRIGPALRVILVYRLQDLTVLLAFAGGGLLLHNRELLVTPIATGVALAAIGGLLVATDLARLAARFAGRAIAALGNMTSWPALARWQRVCSDAVEAVSAPLPLAARLATSACCLVAWCAVTASLWVLFAMIGIRLGLGDVMLVIGGLNLVGALASFTVGGLGVSEGGLAVVLMSLGFPAAGAATAALVVRPLVLLNVLVVGALVEGCLRLRWNRSGATTPIGGRAAGPEG